MPCELIIWGQSSNQNSKKSAQILVRTSAHKPQFLENFLLSLWGWTCMTFGALVRPPTLPVCKFSNLQSSVLLNSRTNHSLLCTMRSLLSKCSCEFDSNNVKWNRFDAGSFVDPFRLVIFEEIFSKSSADLIWYCRGIGGESYARHFF